MKSRIAIISIVFTLLSTAANGENICSIIADPISGAVLLQEGTCDKRVTPASTFKVALAVMGFDSGVLQSATSPVWKFKQGYPAWGGDAWRQDTGPTNWLEHSVVWYSQVIAKKLGEEKLSAYAKQLGYGNGDFSGDKGKNNGLERAWIASSLKISGLEQLNFLTRFVNGTLGVRNVAYQETRNAMPSQMIKGWQVFGKTGMAYPRMENGALDRSHPYGWYVGWAEKVDKRLVFVQLQQDPNKLEGSASTRAKQMILGRLEPMLTP